MAVADRLSRLRELALARAEDLGDDIERECLEHHGECPTYALVILERRGRRLAGLVAPSRIPACLAPILAEAHGIAAQHRHARVYLLLGDGQAIHVGVCAPVEGSS